MTMSRRFINCRPTFICLCLHQKREHWHAKGKCKEFYLCGCSVFREKAA